VAQQVGPITSYAESNAPQPVQVTQVSGDGVGSYASPSSDGTSIDYEAAYDLQQKIAAEEGTDPTSAPVTSQTTSTVQANANTQSLNDSQAGLATPFNGLYLAPGAQAAAYSGGDGIGGITTAALPELATGGSAVQPASTFWSEAKQFGSGLINGFNSSTQGAGSFLADQLLALQSGGFQATSPGQAYNRAVQFTSDQLTQLSEGGFNSTVVGGYAQTLYNRGLEGNADAILNGAVNTAQAALGGAENYFNTHTGNQIAYDSGNFLGEQLPAAVLTAGAGTALEVGGQVLGAVTDAGISGAKFVGSAFIDGLSDDGASSVASQAGAINLFGTSSGDAADLALANTIVDLGSRGFLDSVETGSAKFSELLGLARTEIATGATLVPSTTLGVDAIDTGGLGSIQLKGPFVSSDLGPLTNEQQIAAIPNSTQSAYVNTAYQTLVVDSFGLNQANYEQLLQQLVGFPKLVIVIR
jgi:hypothetical protein